jgi:hypothetical protein
VVSIPDEVIGFVNSPSLSVRALALGSTQKGVEGMFTVLRAAGA